MRIEKSWSASSESDEAQRGAELVHMAGLWDVGIQVRITKPYVFSQGPMEKTALEKRLEGSSKETPWAKP
ncbi:MAG: hypothetical protein CEE40_11575 [Chloroflexi bacterium B3_Chlor]|nr:MAG: hypothetical protein CEE40_11575 [Chloroflexi bacterium B3_Chlor]